MRQWKHDDVIVALGANLQNPAQQLRLAFEEISQLSGCQLLARSSLYGSAPVGPSQLDYVNAVAHVRTNLDPHSFLDQLHLIEQAHQRTREQRWGPRTLDLDIALFGTLVLRDERLILPHASMHERVFVLGPLSELYPDLEIPGMGVSVREQLATLAETGIWPLEDTSI